MESTKWEPIDPATKTSWTRWIHDGGEQSRTETEKLFEEPEQNKSTVDQVIIDGND